MPHITTPDGATLHHTDEGSGPPVVLLHGWGMSAEHFQRTAPLLAGSNRVIALDLRGHGGSVGATSGFTLPQAAQDVHHLLGELDLDGVTLVGWSMGATVVASYVQQFQTDRLAAAVLVDMSPLPIVADDWPHGAFGGLDAVGALDLAAGIAADREAVAEGFLPACFAGAVMPDAETRAWWLQRWMAVRPEALLAFLAGMATMDWREQYAAFDLPVLLCHGTQSALYPTGVGEVLRDGLPDARLVLLDACGHAPFWEDPQAFAAAVSDFMADRAS